MHVVMQGRAAYIDQLPVPEQPLDAGHPYIPDPHHLLYPHQLGSDRSLSHRRTVSQRQPAQTG